MKQSSMIALTGILAISLSSAAWSYDAKMAQSYAKLFSPVVGAKVGKALHFVKPEAFITDIQQGKKFVMIDVRTPAESAIYTFALPNTLTIPADQLFKPENLARIPTDKPVMIVCKSGTRAAVMGTSLRHIGFNNISILKGGFQALISYYGPKEANQKPAPEKK